MSIQTSAGANPSSPPPTPLDLTSLNTELASHGWSRQPLKLTGMSERETSEVVGVMYEIIGTVKSNTDNLESLASRYRTLEYESDRTAKALSLSRTAQRKSEVESTAWRARVTELERRLALEENKVKELREDVSRARKATDAVRIAASQEQNKARIRYEAAQAKIARYASDSSTLNDGQGLQVLNPIGPSRSVPVAVGQAPLLEQSLRDLTEIREAVQTENEDFRHVVVSAGNALREALALTQGDQEPSRLHASQFFTLTPTLRSAYPSISSTPSYPEIANARLLSLIASLRSSLASKIIRIPIAATSAESLEPEEVEARAKLAREEEKRIQDLHDRLKDLEVEVECAKSRADEAKRTIEEMTSVQMVDRMKAAEEKDGEARDLLEILKERERMEMERREVRELKESFERERRGYEAEKRAFQEERRRVDVDSILAQLPSLPSLPPPAQTMQDLSQSPVASSASDSSGSSTGAVADRSTNAHSPIRPFHPVRPRLAHQPSSPSPLSPHKLKTPKAKSHLAGGSAKSKRTRTPLSRLVLEKAVRKGSAADAPASGFVGSTNKKVPTLGGGAGQSAGNGHGNGNGKGAATEGIKALGEGGRRANAAAVPAVPSMSSSLKGKAAAISTSRGSSRADKPKATTLAHSLTETAKAGRVLSGSTSGAGTSKASRPVWR